MNNSNIFKVLGVVGTILGLASTVIGNYASEKNMQATIADEVAKQLSKKER